VAYILDLLNGEAEPDSGRISLEQYVIESSYIPRFLGRVVKDQAVAAYHVLFSLSWFETGQGEVVVTWPDLGSHILSTGGNLAKTDTVKSRIRDLQAAKCISVDRPRSGANTISVCLPSEIPACRELIEKSREPVPEPDESLLDHFTDRTRRLSVLKRWLRLPVLPDRNRRRLVRSRPPCSSRAGRVESKGQPRRIMPVLQSEEVRYRSCSISQVELPESAHHSGRVSCPNRAN